MNRLDRKMQGEAASLSEGKLLAERLSCLGLIRLRRFLEQQQQQQRSSRGAADVPTCIVMSDINLSPSPCSTELSPEEEVKVYCSLLPPRGVTHQIIVKSYLKSIHQYRM